MVPLALLSWIILELTAYALIGRQLFGTDWPTAMVGAVGGLLGVRAGFNAVTWVFGIAFASPARPLGLAGRARLMLAEYGAFLLTFLLVIPFERLWMPADRLRPGTSPILLIHGYGCSRGVWWLLRRRLEAAGYTVATVSLVPPYTSMGKLVPQLNRRIEEVCAATGCQQLTLIAHSMGGLIARACLARYDGARIARLLTLATPHQGSELGRIGLGRNAQEMSPGSVWLKDMAAETPAIPITSLRNPYDNYVMPQDNQRLPGADDIELPPVGHLAMLYDRRVAGLLLDLLKKS